MFTYKSNRVNYVVSIEPVTHLCVLEQKAKGVEYGQYIRMTGQQIDKLRNILFVGNFSSCTYPVNIFEVSGSHITLRCPEENQRIEVDVEDLKEFYEYYRRHKDRIAKYDASFKSRRRR